MAEKVFISYRRDDSRYQARDIHKAFCQVIPRDHVFMDVDTIAPGANFRKTLQDWVNQCEVLLALIGPGWINARDPKTKRRRLDNPSDFVRVEIGEALARDIPVVPVLIDGTPMPDVDLLPDDLKELVDRQAEFVEYRTFDTDVERLIRKLGLAAPNPQEDVKGQLRAKWSSAQTERYQQGIVLRRESPLNNERLIVGSKFVEVQGAVERARAHERNSGAFEIVLSQTFRDPRIFSRVELYIGNVINIIKPYVEAGAGLTTAKLVRPDIEMWMYQLASSAELLFLLSEMGVGLEGILSNAYQVYELVLPYQITPQPGWEKLHELVRHLMDPSVVAQLNAKVQTLAKRMQVYPGYNSFLEFQARSLREYALPPGDYGPGDISVERKSSQ